MTVDDAGEVADEFFGAWTTKNFAWAREPLRDDLSFVGPFDSFSDANSYVAWLRQLGGSSLARTSAGSSWMATTCA
jgi:hypothetical protein